MPSPMEPDRGDELRAKLITRGLPRLESLEQRAEVTALCDGGRQPGELVVQLRQRRPWAGVIYFHLLLAGLAEAGQVT